MYSARCCSCAEQQLRWAAHEFLRVSSEFQQNV